MATKRRVKTKKRGTRRRGGELPLRAQQIAKQIELEKEQEKIINDMSRSYNELPKNNHGEREGERANIANDLNNEHTNQVQHLNKNGNVKKPGLYSRFTKSLARKWKRGSLFKKKDPFNETNEEREERFKKELSNSGNPTYLAH